MTISAKVLDKQGSTILDKSAREGQDPGSFYFDLPCVPEIGCPILIHDLGEYTVHAIVYEIYKNKGSPILILQEKPLDTGIRIAINN
jgi:hypothetical protein